VKAPKRETSRFGFFIYKFSENPEALKVSDRYPGQTDWLAQRQIAEAVRGNSLKPPFFVPNNSTSN
jgi:hypothetical protein